MIETLKSNERLWDLFTRKEEYRPQLLDQFQRFPYYISKHRNIFQPEDSEFLIQNGYKVEYPEGKKFAVCLTHDIDIVYFEKLPLRQIGKSLKLLLGKVIKKYNPLWNFQQIMKLEKRHGAKSSFYFWFISRLVGKSLDNFQ